MKLLYILPILIGLTACSDKPVFVQNGFFCDGAEEGRPTTDIKLYKNYAIISVDGKDIKLEKLTQACLSFLDDKQIPNISLV